jgi:arabinogalactan endo-1,4-beta-galactosidase
MLLFLYFLSIFVVVQCLTWKGVDWSSTLIEGAAGKRYKNAAGTTQPLETILKNSSVNTVRQRLWVNPSNGDYDLAYNMKLAKRAHAAGLEILFDLHFSDTWADPGHQATPSGWPSDINNLAWEVYNYSLSTCDAFAESSTPISILAIGNEITAGLLWPLGGTSSFYNIARLLHSASSGIKASHLATQPKIMIHLVNGWNWGTQKYWYDTVLAQGPLSLADFDIMAVSYYPFYNPSATLANLKSSLSNMAAR